MESLRDPNAPPLFDWTGWTLTSSGERPAPGMRCQVRLRELPGASLSGAGQVRSVVAIYQPGGWRFGDGGYLDTSAWAVLGWRPAPYR